MTTYLIRRIVFAVFTIVGVTMFLSGLMRILPGDPVDVAIGQMGWGEESRPYLVEELGLDEPWPVQYLQWIGGVVQGDLGISLQSRRPITQDLWRRVVVSAELGAMGLAVAFTLGVPLGVIGGLFPGSWMDQTLRGTAIAALSLPGFWVALLVVIWPSVWWGWSPITNYRPIWVDPAGNLLMFALPAALLALNSMGGLMRLSRSSILEVRSADFVRTARAKGLKERHVVRSHILRNSLIPIITLAGLQLPVLIGGSVIFEAVFNLPGMGQMLLQGLNSRDYPLVQSMNLLFASVVVMANLAVDIAYVKIDPRISYS